MEILNLIWYILFQLIPRNHIIWAMTLHFKLFDDANTNNNTINKSFFSTVNAFVMNNKNILSAATNDKNLLKIWTLPFSSYHFNSMPQS